MTAVTIIVAVTETDTGYDVGQFALDTSFPSVPRAGEGLYVAGEGQRIQDVHWFLDDSGTFKAVEVVLSTRRVGSHEPNTLAELRQAGFVPITQHGERMTWEEFETDPSADAEEVEVLESETEQHANQ